MWAHIKYVKMIMSDEPGLKGKAIKLIWRHHPVTFPEKLKYETKAVSWQSKAQIWYTALCWGTILFLERMRKILENLKLVETAPIDLRGQAST